MNGARSPPMRKERYQPFTRSGTPPATIMPAIATIHTSHTAGPENSRAIAGIGTGSHGTTITAVTNRGSARAGERRTATESAHQTHDADGEQPPGRQQPCARGQLTGVGHHQRAARAPERNARTP